MEADARGIANGILSSYYIVTHSTSLCSSRTCDSNSRITERLRCSPVSTLRLQDKPLGVTSQEGEAVAPQEQPGPSWHALVVEGTEQEPRTTIYDAGSHSEAQVEAKQGKPFLFPFALRTEAAVNHRPAPETVTEQPSPSKWQQRNVQSTTVQFDPRLHSSLVPPEAISCSDYCMSVVRSSTARTRGVIQN